MVSQWEQVPFGGVEFAENPEPRCPCVLILDTSGSMSGRKIAELNAGIRMFAEELQSDAIASKRVEVALIAFGPVEVIQHFTTADSFYPTPVQASGDTPMGAAIHEAIRLVTERKGEYRANGIGYYRPWLFLITDGAPTDDTEPAARAIREGEQSNSFAFYAVGVDSADMNRLAHISVKQPLHLRGLSFREEVPSIGV